MKEIGHFIGGKRVAGKSGRFADVYNPSTGEVQAKVALATQDEVRAAVENAAAAQPKWAAVNPQRRARVMMKFIDLVARDNEKLAETLSREHGKTIPDAKGDIQRGIEVAEFALGIPHLMKGEYTESAGPGIDMFSMRQPLGVARRHHAVQLPGHDPDVEVLPGDCVRQRIHPEALRARSLRADAAGRTDDRGRLAGRHPQRRQRRQGRPSMRSWTTRRSRPLALSDPPQSPSTSIRAAARPASACSASVVPRTT
jgi:hypothetical protein